MSSDRDDVNSGSGEEEKEEVGSFIIYFPHFCTLSSIWSPPPPPCIYFLCCWPNFTSKTDFIFIFGSVFTYVNDLYSPRLKIAMKKWTKMIPITAVHPRRKSEVSWRTPWNLIFFIFLETPCNMISNDFVCRQKTKSERK